MTPTPQICVSQTHHRHSLPTVIPPTPVNRLRATITTIMAPQQQQRQQQQIIKEDDCLSRIGAMMQQESKFYSCHDYCKIHDDWQNCYSVREDRKLMLQWSYNVVDFFSLERETAGIALSYSDRFLQTKELGLEYLVDTEKYQLLCIAALYVAIKIHEPASLTPQAFVEIGRGQYTVQQLEDMEKKLLKALEWRVNPPTSLEFVRNYLELIPSSQLSKSTKATVYVLARAQTERALSDYSLLSVEAARIAFASVQNALDALGQGNSPALYILASRIKRDHYHFELDHLRRRLCSAITWQTSTIEVATDNRNKSANGKSIYGDSLQGFRKQDAENTTPRSVTCENETFASA